jgi:hypothetical protein
MMREGGNPLYWLGVYDERYRRGDGGWRISKQSLNFVWPSECSTTDSLTSTRHRHI